MDYKEFNTKVRRAGSHSKAKVNNSWGVYDSYKHIRKNGWYDIGRPLKEHEFYTIVRSVNNYLADEVANGNTITFPLRMGKLELRKMKRGASIVDGKLKINYPINWSETLKLWYEDAEAMKNKTLLREETKYVYHIKYCRHDATFENKTFYEFALNRFIKRALKENIKEGKTDTLW